MRINYSIEWQGSFSPLWYIETTKEKRKKEKTLTLILLFYLQFEEFIFTWVKNPVLTKNFILALKLFPQIFFFSFWKLLKKTLVLFL